MLSAQIDQVPHFENFDALTLPALPAGWQTVVPSVDSYIRTDNINPFSSPNCLWMYSGSQANGDMYLILPEIAPPLSISDLRMRFRMRSSPAHAIISVGTMTDPTNPNTFSMVDYFTPGSVWKERVIDLSMASSGPTYIAFRYVTSGWVNTYFFIDDLHLEMMPQHDLAFVSWQGNPTPSSGVPLTYQVSIANLGSVTQTDYTVKLLDINNVVLGSASGVAVPAGETAVVNLLWTPGAPGMRDVRLSIDLTSDEYLYNNSSSTFVIAIQDGMINPPAHPTQPARIPLDFYYKNSLCQYIIYPDQVSLNNYQGMIYAIQLVNNFVSDLSSKPTKIWIGNTSLSNLSTGWVPIEQMTMVFDGLQNYPSGINNVRFNLQVPFYYDGYSNLVIMFHRPMDTDYFNSIDRFLCHALTPNRSRRVYSDTAYLDPANPTSVNVSMSNEVPVTTFFIGAATTGTINGVVRDVHGLPLSGVEVRLGNASVTSNISGSYQFSGVNAGVYEISFEKPDYYGFAQDLLLSPGQTQTFDVYLTRMRGTLYGIVRDSGQNPLAGVMVQSGAQSASTNAEGQFSLTLEVGTHNASFALDGYRPYSAEGIVIGAEQLRQLDVTLYTFSHVTDPIASPELLSITGIHPNPFSAEVKVAVELRSDAQVSVAIFNQRGQKIRNISSAKLAKGNHEIVWDGMSDAGLNAGSGVYLMQINAGGTAKTAKLLRIRQ